MGANKAGYFARYRTQPAGRWCDCGRPAWRFAKCGWECERCAALTEVARQREARRSLAGTREYGGTRDVQELFYYRPPAFTATLTVTRRALVLQAHGTYRLNLK